MQNLGVITPVSEPSDWCHQMVVADKPNGKLRVCMDPKHLNKYLKREEFQIPDFETLSTELSEAVIMSTIDLTSGFWQFGVDTESAKLLTFATPFGRYRYNRLPFGLSCAPEMFHKRIVEVLAHIPGVIVYIDDILVWGRTQEEHDERLEQVLRALRDASLSINDSKCEIGKSRVKFLGHVVEGGKLYPDPEKIKAISNFPSPQDKKSLKRFLGMMSFLRKFVKNYNEMTDLFRPLLKERHEWLWTPTHEAMMEKIRAVENWTTALRIFRPGEPVELFVDASGTGLGAVLTQGGEPVYFASRTLTPAEEKYPQIEKELLALVWAFERLDLYTYGSRVTAYTDHKPLLGLKEKPLDYLSTRQQRYMGRLQRYHFDLKFVPGKELTIPDCLSRAPLPETEKHEKRWFMGTDIETEMVYVSALEYTALSDELRVRLMEESKEDEQYQATIKAYRTGWLETDKSIVGDYWSDRTEIFEEGEILYYRGRPVIPQGARERFLESIHRGHVGNQTCLKRAQRVWWPGMSQDIKTYVKTCHTCQTSADQQRDEPMKSFEVPAAPGLVIGSDFFDCGRDQYVIFVDLFSSWVEFFKVTTKDAKNLIQALRVFMTRNGIPRVFTSDQGSAYTSGEFKEFCVKNGITRKDGSAKHERGNAHAEAAVKKIKKLLNRCANEDELMSAILAWHQTEMAPGRPSPAQVHLGRNLRDDLHWNVQQALVQWSEVKDWKEKKNDKAKEYFDRGTRALKVLDEGQKVLVRVTDEWKEGKIKRKLERPRSYEVEMENGRVLERNRVKLKPDETLQEAETSGDV
jgi:transposase InsO family protein